MIRPLRCVHRWLFVGLAVALPAVLVSALTSRTSRPTPAAPHSALTPPAPGDLTTGIGIAYLGKRLTAKVGTDSAGRRYLVVTKSFDSVDPDLHLYWVPTESPDAMPGDGSYLIGTFGESAHQVFRLPDAVVPNSGQLVLFSLAGGQVVASAPFAVR